MNPLRHLKRKLASHLEQGKRSILSPDFDPGRKSVDYWLGYFDGVAWGYQEGIEVMEAAERQRSSAPDYIR